MTHKRKMYDCTACGAHTYDIDQNGECVVCSMPKPTCSTCHKESDDLTEEFSMGIYAGRYCSKKCWRESGYRDVGPEAFDATYAGESLEDEGASFD